LALLDGPLSVLRSDQHPENPNDKFPRLAIERLEVTNAKYIGRLETGAAEPFRVTFNPWLNTIIGGRGTGKSSLLEFLRITMRRDKELEQYETIYQDFKKYITNYTDDEAGLLLDETNLRVIYRKDGVRFRVQWNVDGNSPALGEETGDGAWITAEGEVASRFPVSIYSQKQLYALADNPSALLARIDDTVEVDGRQWKQKWNELITQYHAGCSAIREFQAQLTDEQRVKGTLADVKRQLHLFETENTRTVLQTFQKLGQQRAALDQWQKHLQANRSRIAEFRQEMIIETPDMSVFRATQADEKAVLDRVAEINDAWAKVTSALKTAEEEAAKISSEWSKWLAGTAWTKQADEIKRQYDELIERLKQEGMKDPSLYGQKVQERQVLEKRLKEFQGYRDGIKVLEENTTRLLKEIAVHRRKLTKNRRLFLQTVLADNPYVRMEIVPYGDTEAAFVSFKELIERADDRFDKDIYDEDGQSGIFAHLYFTADKGYVQNWLELEPAHKQQVETEFEDRLADLKKKILSDPKSLNLRGWVETHLSKRGQSPEFSEKLTVWFPEDLIRVSYSSPSFRKFRGLDNASPGQKTAAILAFVLSHGEDPIILDQPEDDLDNHLIYELVVRQIQENKRRRQVIIVTHNANIVVNGDSELVLALISKDGRTVMEAQGGLQETAVRDKICEIMEGGRDAFERRYSRILGGVEHV
jgi:hypothetical protein